MRPTGKKTLLASGLVLIALGGLAGCQTQPHHPGPPHHPPAPGVQWLGDDYFFYPRAGVYFHIHSGYYWYHERGHWYRARRLPPYIVILPRDRVHVRVDHDEPWRRHREHMQRYPAYVVPHRHRDPVRLQERSREEREHNRRLYHEYGELPEGHVRRW